MLYLRFPRWERGKLLLRNPADNTAQKDSPASPWRFSGPRSLFSPYWATLQAKTRCCLRIISETFASTYLGCYIDHEDVRDFTYVVTWTDLTPQKCIRHCADLGFDYAGLQYGIEVTSTTSFRSSFDCRFCMNV
ncbi:Hypp2300 [Branchiostoma lanceolatum]|uniref:Hypp2300 protein n=1 Tax=Branchiostoma lanceolatum TaxID=7740 RepID=A0A8J9ZU29_BRALA|nr:Hypp2300 [Branchiostoma lanceolatum]